VEIDGRKVFVEYSGKYDGIDGIRRVGINNNHGCSLNVSRG